MKKSILALASLLIVASCNKTESNADLYITGNIKGLKKGTLYIQRIVDTALVAIDTIVIDGKSTFEAELDLKSPEMLYLFLDRGVSNSKDNNIAFFAEPGKMTIETTLDEYSKINSKFNEENLDLIAKKFRAIKYKKETAVDSLTKKQESNIKRKYLFATNFAINNKDHEIAPYIALAEIYDINLKYLDTIQKSMTPKVAQSLYGKKLTSYVNDIKKQ